MDFCVKVNAFVFILIKQFSEQHAVLMNTYCNIFPVIGFFFFTLKLLYVYRK